MEQDPLGYFSNYNVILMTPEKLVGNDNILTVMKKLMEADKSGRIIIDECHCLQTFEKFRPSYDNLAACYQRHFKELPISFFTATSTKRMREKIEKDFDVHPIVTLGNDIINDIISKHLITTNITLINDKYNIQ